MIAIIKHKPLMGQRARDGISSAFVTGRAVMFYRHRLQSSNRFSATVPKLVLRRLGFRFRRSRARFGELLLVGACLFMVLESGQIWIGRKTYNCNGTTNLLLTARTVQRVSIFSGTSSLVFRARWRNSRCSCEGQGTGILSSWKLNYF
jgi:hypothetical protein